MYYYLEYKLNFRKHCTHLHICMCAHIQYISLQLQYNIILHIPFKSSGVTIPMKWKARSFLNTSYAHLRILRIHLTAAIPLFAMRIWKSLKYLITTVSFTVTILHKYFTIKSCTINFSLPTLVITLFPPNFLTNSCGVATLNSFWSGGRPIASSTPAMVKMVHAAEADDFLYKCSLKNNSLMLLLLTGNKKAHMKNSLLYFTVQYKH